MRVVAASQGEDWVREFARRSDCGMCEVSVQADSWVDETCEEVRRALSDGWEAVAVVCSLRVLRRGVNAAAQLLAAGADDVIDASAADATVVLEQSLQRIARLLHGCHSLEIVGGLDGRSAAIQRARKELALALEDSDMPVLILGETGTGKQLAAKALHRLDAKRTAAPFHAVDCGSVVDSLFGSELFGHVQGAFTGAQSSRPGAFASAGDGTVFLDEIGELSPQLQAGFLSALQERKYRPVGSDREYPIKCRIVAATNRDLPRLVEAGKFRRDLFCRLDGMRVVLPTLKQRREDIAPLFRRFAQRHNTLLTDIDSDVLKCLLSAELHGNVRELETIARRCALASKGSERIRLAHLPLAVLEGAREVKQVSAVEAVSDMVVRGMRLDEILAECSGRAVESALQLAAHTDSSVRKSEMVKFAAERLGVSPRTIYGKLHGGDSRGPVKH